MNTFNIDEFNEHLVSEVICLKCLRRWVAVRPLQTPLKELECPKCHERGFVIETGEFLDQQEGGSYGREDNIGPYTN